MQQTFLDKGKYLLVSAGGTRSKAEIAKAVREVDEYCRERGVKRVLVDARGTYGDLSLADWFELWSDEAEMRTAKISRVALLHQGDIPDFAETAAVNRGIPIKLFSDLAAAERWVIEEPG